MRSQGLQGSNMPAPSSNPHTAACGPLVRYPVPRETPFTVGCEITLDGQSLRDVVLNQSGIRLISRCRIRHDLEDHRVPLSQLNATT